MRASPIVVALAVLIHAAPAATQPGMTPVPAAPPAIEAGIVDDASSGRAWVTPTALTPPAGTSSAQSVELAVIGVGYSFTDRLVVSASTLLLPGAAGLLIANAKLKLVDSGRLKIAAHLNADFVDGLSFDDDGDAEEDEDDDGAAGVAFLGGVVTYCLDPGCRSTVNGYLSSGYLFHAERVQRAVPFVGSVAWTQQLGRMKLMLEAMGTVAAGGEDGDAILAWYGLRFPSRHVTLDVGLVKPLCSDCDGGVKVGLPWVAFSFRSL